MYISHSLILHIRREGIIHGRSRILNIPSDRDPDPDKENLIRGVSGSVTLIGIRIHDKKLIRIRNTVGFTKPVDVEATADPLSLGPL